MTTNRKQSTYRPKHGLNSTYCNWACRCGKCRAAHTAYCRDLRARRKQLMKDAA